MADLKISELTQETSPGLSFRYPTSAEGLIRHVVLDDFANGIDFSFFRAFNPDEAKTLGPLGVGFNRFRIFNGGVLITGENAAVVVNGTGVFTSLLVGNNSSSETGFFSILAGTDNSVTGIYSSVIGGSGNLSSGVSSAAGGGINNQIIGSNGTVIGGEGNLIDNNNSTVGAGLGNQIDASGAFIGGGQNNDVGPLGTSASIIAGFGNTVLSQYSLVGGGINNVDYSSGSAVFGGQSNQTKGPFDFIGAGLNNLSTDPNSSIGGGEQNIAKNLDSAVVGGTSNQASGLLSFVGGGNQNLAKGTSASIVNGQLLSLQSGSNVAFGGSNLTSTGNLNFVGTIRASQSYGSGNSLFASDLSILSGNFQNIFGQNVTGFGTESVIFGGSRAGFGATSLDSVIYGGDTNNATSNYSVVGDGQGNSNRGQYSVLLQGTSNTISADNSTLILGRSSSIGGNYSLIFGANAVVNGAGSLFFGGSGIWSNRTLNASDQLVFDFQSGFFLSGSRFHLQWNNNPPTAYNDPGISGAMEMADYSLYIATGNNLWGRISGQAVWETIPVPPSPLLGIQSPIIPVNYEFPSNILLGDQDFYTETWKRVAGGQNNNGLNITLAVPGDYIVGAELNIDDSSAYNNYSGAVFFFNQTDRVKIPHSDRIFGGYHNHTDDLNEFNLRNFSQVIMRNKITTTSPNTLIVISGMRGQCLTTPQTLLYAPCSHSYAIRVG